MFINRCETCVKNKTCSIKRELEEFFEHLEEFFMDTLTTDDISIKLSCKHYEMMQKEEFLEQISEEKTKGKKKGKKYE